jgi:hypothetical protein
VISWLPSFDTKVGTMNTRNGVTLIFWVKLGEYVDTFGIFESQALGTVQLDPSGHAVSVSTQI